MDIIKPVSEVRSSLPSLINRIKREKKHVVITKNGTPAAVIITPEELETLEILADKELMDDLNRAIKDLKSGNVYSHENIFKGV